MTNKSQLWTKIRKFIGYNGTEQLFIEFSSAPMVPLLSERVRPYNGFKCFGF